MEQLIVSIRIDKNYEIRFNMALYEGRWYLDIRAYRGLRGGTSVHTGRGVKILLSQTDVALLLEKVTNEINRFYSDLSGEKKEAA